MTEYNTDSNRYITKTLVAFISTIGNEHMLNIINDEHNIYIGTYKVTADKLDINLLSNAVSETNEYTSADLRKFLEQYKTEYNSWPYDTDKDYTGFTKKMRGRR